MTEATRKGRTFAKVYTDLDDHPAWINLDPEHVGLWLLSLLYCRRNLTDGHFPERLLRRWGGSDSGATGLVEAGRWHRSGHGCADCPQPGVGQMYLHAYLEVQNSRAEYDLVCAKRAVAGAKGGRARAAAQASDLQEKQSGSNLVSKGLSKIQAKTSKSKLEVEVEVEKNTPAAAAAEFESWWEMYPRKIGKAAAAKAYTKARRDVDTDTLLAGLANATQVWKATGTEPQFIPHASTWLNAGRWADEVPLPNMPTELRATIRQCSDESPHGRHEKTDHLNRFVCMGVPA